MLRKPAQPTHPRLAKVRTDAERATMMRETKENQTVHAPCSDRALNATLVPLIPAPAQRTHATLQEGYCQQRIRAVQWFRLWDHEDSLHTC